MDRSSVVAASTFKKQDDARGKRQFPCRGFVVDQRKTDG
jgi:hypothetical protein